MKPEVKERLIFRRQYLITTKKIQCPFLHQAIELGQDFILYAHIDLPVTIATRNDRKLILLGDILDWEYPEKTNSEIINDIIEGDFENFLNNTADYAGRYVIIHIDPSAIRLMHDATACRKIYYHKGVDISCASQPHLLAQVLGIKETTDPEKKCFYESEAFQYLNHANIGNLTFYDEILQLLPNHYLSLTTGEVKRYWINKITHQASFDDIVNICGSMIKGYIESIANRYNIMLPVTAGKDSRTLLAATRDIANKVFYYVNKENRLDGKSPDILVPQKLIGKKLNLPFHILDPYVEIEEDFKEIYFKNNPYASEFYLPHIYNYYLWFQDKVNLPGNFVASAFDMYGDFVTEATPEILATFNKVKHYTFAVDYYRKWLDQAKGFCDQHQIHLMMLFYWEERLANWGTQVQIDKDIAQEDIIPFNSRNLIQYFFSVNHEYIDRPDFLLFKRIMKNLWPELLEVPTNPTLKNKLTKLIYQAGLLVALRKLLFWYQIKLKSSISTY